MVDMLWAPPRLREAAESVPEDAGDDVDVNDIQRYSNAVLHAARHVLALTRTAPSRLSDLLTAAAAIDPAAVDGAVDDVVELVLLSSLWAFDADAVDDQRSRAARSTCSPRALKPLTMASACAVPACTVLTCS